MKSRARRRNVKGRNENIKERMGRRKRWRASGCEGSNVNTTTTTTRQRNNGKRGSSISGPFDLRKEGMEGGGRWAGRQRDKEKEMKEREKDGDKEAGGTKDASRKERIKRRIKIVK